MRLILGHFHTLQAKKTIKPLIKKKYLESDWLNIVWLFTGYILVPSKKLLIFLNYIAKYNNTYGGVINSNGVVKFDSRLEGGFLGTRLRVGVVSVGVTVLLQTLAGLALEEEWDLVFGNT